MIEHAGTTGRMLILLAVLASLAPTPAVAVLHGHFAGTITSGADPTLSFGLPNLSGLGFTGTLAFDPGGFEPLSRVAGEYEYGEVYGAPDLLSVALTINGQTRTVLGTYLSVIAYDYPAGIHGVTAARFTAHPVLVDRISSVSVQVFSSAVAFLTPDGGITQSYAVSGLPSAAWFTVLADDAMTQYEIGLSVTAFAVPAPALAGLPMLVAGLVGLPWLRRRKPNERT